MKGTPEVNAKKILGWTAGVVLGVTLLACGGGTKPSEGTSADKGAAAAGSEAPAKEDGPVIAQLGSKGLEFEAEKIDVSISKPGAYKPSQYMPRVPKGSKAFVLTVKVTNRNTQAIKVDSISFTASLGEANAEAEQIIDTEAGVKGTPSTALLPGKTATFKIGFQAPATEAHPVININVTPWELGGATGLFQGKL